MCYECIKLNTAPVHIEMQVQALDHDAEDLLVWLDAQRLPDGTLPIPTAIHIHHIVQNMQMHADQLRQLIRN